MQAREKALEVRNLIGGEWIGRDGRETEPVYDPATGESPRRPSPRLRTWTGL